MGPLRVLIADDHSLVRQGLVKVINLDEGLEVVGEAADGEEAVVEARQLQPDVILMDLHMPKKDGLEAARIIKGSLPQIRIIALTVDDTEQKVVEVIRAGVDGYLLKDVQPDALALTIKAVCAGETVIHPQITSLLLREWERVAGPVEVAEPSVNSEGLTPRERQILMFIAQGVHNKDIAECLYISEKTVKNHVTSIFRKLQVEDRTQAALSAIRRRLVNI